MLIPPVIDPREWKHIVAQMEEMAPFYTPEWKFTPDAPDPGTALFLLFADMLQNNIRRLNRVPHKQFVAYLNMLGVTLLPARPAAGYAVFELAAGTKTTVPLPAATPVAGKSADGKDVPFETAAAIRLTPVKVVEIVHVHPGRDAIVRTSGPYQPEPDSVLPPIRLFDTASGDNLQEHALYVSHPEALYLRHAAQIELTLGHSQQQYRLPEFTALLSDPQTVTWSYATGEGWQPFDAVTGSSESITLHKRSDTPLAEQTVDGRTSLWLRCTRNAASTGSATGSLAPEEVRLDRLRIRTAHSPETGHEGFRPDRMFWNDAEIDPETGGYAFGRTFAPYSVFYVSSREAFGKKGATVRLTFRLNPATIVSPPLPTPPIDWKPIMKQSTFERPDPPELLVERVLWEYWDGGGWARLFKGAEYETIFASRDAGECTLEFQCPPNMTETFVNAQANFWIRARIVSMDGVYTAAPTYISPVVEDLRLAFDYGTASLPVTDCLAYNNAEWLDCGPHLAMPGTPFSPFSKLEGRGPAVYFGFDAAPKQGPLQLLFSLEPSRNTGGSAPLMEWEYAAGSSRGVVWNPLKVTDDTEGFTRTGTVRFSGPSDAVAVSRFGRTLYWIRAVSRDGRFDETNEPSPFPLLYGLYMNGVRIVQQESRDSEMPLRLTDRSDDGALSFRLAAAPVLDEHVWVDETDGITEDEVDTLQKKDPDALQVKRDSSGKLHRVWVRWQVRDDLYQSGETDRHYTVDRATGFIRFGDGKHGGRLPNDGAETLKISYKTGGGVRGNLDALQVNKLKRSIAFVSGVFNPEPTGGGSEGETLDAAMQRGPQRLKHRDRAITPGDFEWLAREACPNLVKVKCLANMNVQMQQAAGFVTLVVLTDGGPGDGGRFAEYERAIGRYLTERAPSALAFPGRIRIIPPVFLEISVSASLTVRDASDALDAEGAAIAALERYLHPVTGSADGTGWGIGQPVHPSVFYGVLKAVPGISYVSDVMMTVSRLEHGQRMELDASAAFGLPNSVVCGGVHRLDVTIL